MRLIRSPHLKHGKGHWKLAMLMVVTGALGPSLASAAVLYKTGFGVQDGNNNASSTSLTSTYTATGGSASGVAAGGLGEGRGDDYTTGFTSLSLTSLRFYGSLQPNADGVAIEFYNADKTRNSSATIYPSNSIAELLTTGAHTVTLSSPITISGSGYIVFAPYTYNYANGAAPQITLGYSNGNNAALYDVGTNNAASSVEANYGPSFPSSTDRTLSFVDVPNVPDRLSLELDGTGLPEPTSIALIAPVAMLLKRRRCV